MQFKSLLVTSAVSALAAATTTVTVTVPPPSQTPPPASQCNTENLQCCNTLQAANDSILSPIFGLLNIVVQPITALVGINCTPINVLGIGAGGACTAQPVCCQNNNFSGIIAIGCVPISITL
ncbi:fungal hydrophobin-domain-containing protein [Panaeolus papilionaceus]|nr:fungal hydrophobin-domain-containing protein [Panaeolus papilionaceus]